MLRAAGFPRRPTPTRAFIESAGTHQWVCLGTDSRRYCATPHKPESSSVDICADAGIRLPHPPWPNGAAANTHPGHSPGRSLDQSRKAPRRPVCIATVTAFPPPPEYEAAKPDFSLPRNLFSQIPLKELQILDVEPREDRNLQILHCGQHNYVSLQK